MFLDERSISIFEENINRHKLDGSFQEEKQVLPSSHRQAPACLNIPLTQVSLPRHGTSLVLKLARSPVWIGPLD